MGSTWSVLIWLGRGSLDGLRGINGSWGIRKLWEGEILGSRGEKEFIMARFGGRSWERFGCMTLGDWITLFLALYLDKVSSEKNLLQGGDDVDFGGLGLCGGWGMGRGLGWWFWTLSSEYAEFHGGFGFDETWGLWSLKHGGRGYMSWKVDFLFWFARLKIEFLSSSISLAMIFLFEELSKLWMELYVLKG